MSLKDLSPIKQKQPQSNTNNGVYSAMNFADQVEQVENSKKIMQNQVGGSTSQILPNIDTSRQKRVLQLQSIPNSILDEINQKRQHVNPIKQLGERRQTSSDKINQANHYYTTKSFNNQTSLQKNSSLTTVNQSPISKAQTSKHYQSNIIQITTPPLLQNSQSQTIHNSSGIFQNNTNNNSSNGLNQTHIVGSNLNGSLNDLQRRSINQNKQNNGQINQDMISMSDQKGYNQQQNNNNNNHQQQPNNSSFINVSQLINSQRNLDEQSKVPQSKIQKYDSNNNKGIMIETDIQKLRNNMMQNNNNNNNDAQPRLSFSSRNYQSNNLQQNYSSNQSNISSSILQSINLPHISSVSNHISSIHSNVSTSTNKLLHQHPSLISSQYQNKLGSLAQPQIDFSKRLTADLSDFKMKEESTKNQNIKRRAEQMQLKQSSSLNIQNNQKEEELKQKQYIRECVQQDLKKEILNKSDIKDILISLQKNFNYVKISQNNLKKSGERKDAVSLSQWFDEITLNLLDQNDFTLLSFLDEYEIAYNACLSEICRQVSNDCFERGQLIEKLWKIILFISKEFMKKAQAKYKSVEMSGLQEEGRIHNMYQDQINSVLKNNAQLNIVLEQKDVLIRKLYQQKEAAKKKSKKFELMHSVLYEDFEFLERYLENLLIQNVQIKQRLMSYEAQERLYIKDSDPKQKIKEEINKITSTLSDQYLLQLENEKHELQDLYEHKKDARYKQTVIEKNLDYEFKNGKIEKKGDYNMNVPEGDDIQLEDDYQQIEMNDQETSTEDLFQQGEIATGTEDLCIQVSQGTMVWISTDDQEIQVNPITKEFGTQADIKRIIGSNNNNDNQGIKKLESISEIMKEFEEMKLPIDELKNKNYNQIQSIIQNQYERWNSKNKELINAFQYKDEYTSQDYDYLRNYLQTTSQKSIEFMMEQLQTILKEHQIGIQYKIETLESKLDNDIAKQREEFQMNTLKKIIPKYNELKKELQLSNSNQVIFQQQSIQQSNIMNRRRLPANNQNQMYSLNKQSSFNQIDNITDSPEKRNTRRSIEQIVQFNSLTQRSFKRSKTIKKDEAQSPTRQLSQQSQKLITSSSNINTNSSYNNNNNSQSGKKSSNGSQKLINSMKSAIQKINNDYLKSKSPQSTPLIQNPQENMSYLPDISKTLRQGLAQTLIQNESKDKNNLQQNDQKISQIKAEYYANDQYNNQSNNQTGLKSVQDGKSDNEKENTQLLSTLNDIQIDQSLESSSNIQNEQKQQEIKNNNPQVNSFHLNAASLANIIEQPEPDDNTTTPKKQYLNQKNLFSEAQSIVVINQTSLNASIDNKLQDNKENKKNKPIQNEYYLNDLQNQDEINDEDKSNTNIMKDQNELNQISPTKMEIQESDLSSDSDNDDNDKLKKFITNKEQIQDQMYDKKYLDESIGTDGLTKTEQDEFELALKNLDSSVNNVQPNPNLYSRMRIHASTSKFTDIGTDYLIKSFKEIKKKKNANFYFKLSQILKIIFNILQDIQKSCSLIPSSPTNKNSNPTKYHSINHFHIHLFENLMTSYGTGQMMFKKYFRILNGIFKYKKHPRINIVSKFLTGEYDLNDFQVFVKVCINLFPELQSNEERIIINQQRCNEALNHFLYSNLPQKQSESIEKIINKIKIKGVQKNQFVYDFDQILELIMETFVKDVKIQKTEDYRDIYYSQDTEKRDYFNYESFKTVLQCLQQSKLSFIQNLFYKESDKILNGENLLSLQRFSLICRQNKILSSAIQKKYLVQPSEEFIQDMSKRWNEEQYNIKLRLIKVNKYDMKRRKMLNEIDIYMKDSSKSRHSACSIHFICNLLLQESQQLLVEEHLNQLIPSTFIHIQNKYESIMKINFKKVIEE